MKSEHNASDKEDFDNNNISALLQDSLIGNNTVLDEMRVKAPDFCKKEQLRLNPKKRFLSSEILKLSNEIKIEKNKEVGEQKMAEIKKCNAAKTVPESLVLNHSCLKKAFYGIFTLKDVSKNEIFGPFIGKTVYDRQEAYKNGFCWDIYKNNKFNHCVDASNPSESNWMRFVNPSDSSEHQNLEAFQRGYQVYFRAIKDIPVGTELLVWYSLQYNNDCHHFDTSLDFQSGKSFEDIILSISQLQKQQKLPKSRAPRKSFIKKYSSTTYKKIGHLRKTDFPCDFCDKTYSRKHHLDRHLQHHTGKKSHRCGICDKGFVSKYGLNIHQLIHTGEKPYKCCICGRAFNQKFTLTCHKLIHAEEKPFKCELCEKAYTTVYSLNKHKRVHTGENHFVCDICDKSYSQMYILARHKLVHTGEQPFKCHVCDKAFVHRYTFNQHMCIHTGEKSFQCDLCHKAFRMRSHLNEHKRVHTGEKPFKCDICDKAFGRRNAVNKHKILHHVINKSPQQIPQSSETLFFKF